MKVRLTGGCTLLKSSGSVQVLDPGGALGLTNLGLFSRGTEKLKIPDDLVTLLSQNDQICLCVCVVLVLVIKSRSSCMSSYH